MNFMIVVVLFAALAYAKAGVIVAPSAEVIQGPSTKTTVVGPDGSVITSVAPGGKIITNGESAVVAQDAPAAAISPAVEQTVPEVVESLVPVVAQEVPNVETLAVVDGEQRLVEVV